MRGNRVGRRAMVSIEGESGLGAMQGRVIPVRLSPGEAARKLREAFLERGWPSSREVGSALGASDPVQHAAELRAANVLLGAWSAPKRTYVHPDCQFAEVSRPVGGVKYVLRPAVRELLQILPSEGDEGGWRRVFWLYGPRWQLDGCSPADVMQRDPQRVIELARYEFASAASSPGDAG